MISHKHHCVFVHIPKCAGQSIETAFLEDLGLDWETRAVLLLRSNDRPEIGPPRLAHLIARDYMRHHYLSRELYERYFTFSVVRNPWARAVSMYRYLDINESFSDFVEKRLMRSLGLGEADVDYWFFRPQIDYVTDETGEIIVDRIVHFEYLAEGFEQVAVEVGLKTPLRHVNKSEPGTIRQEEPVRRVTALRQSLVDLRLRLVKARRGIGALNARTKGKVWRDFYDDATRAQVAKLYAGDVVAFGYAFDSDSPTAGETSR